MPAPSGVRLRDSCEACAASKTKCSKDKPQCTRCKKRGTSCHYLVTQRTGRKACSRNGRKDDTTPPPTHSRTTTPEPPEMLSNRGRQSRPEPSRANTQVDGFEPTTLPPITDDCFSMLLTDLDFSAPVQPYDNAIDLSEVPIEYMLGVSHNASRDMSHKCFHRSLAAEACAQDQHDLPFQSSGQSSLSSQYLDAQDGNQAAFANATACSLPYEQLFQELGNCEVSTLSQQQEGIKLALQLMAQLCCPEDGSAYANLSPSERKHWANALVDKCKSVTGTVSDMLQCHSSDDGYFLALVCLVMSKVLDAYVMASEALGPRVMDEQRMSLSSSSSVPSSVSATGSDSSRGSVSLVAREGDPKAVQQLLDELYQVRASMDLLGVKIAHMLSRRDGMFGANIPASQCDYLATTLPFSAEIVNQLYEEQRRRMTTTSLKLINILKAFWVDENSG